MIRSVLDDLKKRGLLKPAKKIEVVESPKMAEVSGSPKSDNQPQSNFCPLGERYCGFVDIYYEMNHVFCCYDSANAKNIKFITQCPRGHKPRLSLVKNEKLTQWFPSNNPEILCVDCENLEKLYCTRSDRNAYVNIKSLERCPDGKWTVDQETGSCETCALHDNPNACDSSEPMSWTTYAERCVKFFPAQGTEKE